MNPKMLLEIKQAMGRFCTDDGAIYERLISISFGGRTADMSDTYSRVIHLRERTDSGAYTRLAKGTGFREHAIYDRDGAGNLLPQYGNIYGFVDMGINEFTRLAPMEDKYTAPEPESITGLSVSTGSYFPWGMADDYIRYKCQAAEEDRSECNVYDWRGVRMEASTDVTSILGQMSNRFQDSTDVLFVDDPFSSSDDPSNIIGKYAEDREQYESEQYLRFMPRRCHVCTQLYAVAGASTLRFYNEPHIGEIKKLYPDAWYEPVPE